MCAWHEQTSMKCSVLSRYILVGLKCLLIFEETQNDMPISVGLLSVLEICPREINFFLYISLPLSGKRDASIHECASLMSKQTQIYSKMKGMLRVTFF